MTSTRAYRVWLERLSTNTLTVSQIRQFAAAISTVAVGEDSSGRESALTGDERLRLFRRVKARPVRLAANHEAKALAWFKDHASEHQHAGGLGMSRYERDLVLEYFSHFSFDGEYVRSGLYVWPVWTVNLKPRFMRHRPHDKLQYFAVPWQSRSDDVWPDYWWGNEGRNDHVA